MSWANERLVGCPVCKADQRYTSSKRAGQAEKFRINKHRVPQMDADGKETNQGPWCNGSFYPFDYISTNGHPIVLEKKNA